MSTNWQILTGGPRTGKTTVLREIAARGYKTTPEAARVHINNMKSKGYSKEEIFDDSSYQYNVIEVDRRIENNLDEDKLAFRDRSILDNVAYGREFEGKDRPHLVNECRGRFDNVFVLEPLEYEKDGVRREDREEAQMMHQKLIDTYKEAGYDPIKIPVEPVRKRADKIIQEAKK